MSPRPLTNLFREVSGQARPYNRLSTSAARHEAVYARPANQLVVHRRVMRERVVPSGLCAELLLRSAAHMRGSLLAHAHRAGSWMYRFAARHERLMHDPQAPSPRPSCSAVRVSIAQAYLLTCSVAQSRAERCRVVHQAESCRCHSPPWLSWS